MNKFPKKFRSITFNNNKHAKYVKTHTDKQSHRYTQFKLEGPSVLESKQV